METLKIEHDLLNKQLKELDNPLLNVKEVKAEKKVIFNKLNKINKLLEIPTTKRKYKEIQIIEHILKETYSKKVIFEFLNQNYFLKENSLKKILLMDLKGIEIKKASLALKAVFQFYENNKKLFRNMNIETSKFDIKRLNFE